MAAVSSAASLIGRAGPRTAWSLRQHNKISLDTPSDGKVSLGAQSNGNARAHTWTKSQTTTPVKPPSQRRNFADDEAITPASPRPEPQYVPGLLAQLESDYKEIKKADATLHGHLGQWLTHMEQWMHVQQNLYAQLQEHCQQIDFDSESLMEAPLSPYSSAPTKTETRPLLNMETPRLPVAVAMKEPEDKTLLVHRHALDARSHNNIAFAENSLTPPPLNVSQPQIDVSPHGVLLEELPTPLNENVALGQHRTSAATNLDGRHSQGTSVDRHSHVTSVALSSRTPRFSDQTVNTRPTMASRVSQSNNWRSSLSVGEYEALPKEYKMWVEVVRSILTSAQKRKYYELRECWKKEDQFMTKYLRANHHLDMKVLTKPKVKNESPGAHRVSWHNGLQSMAGIQPMLHRVPDFRYFKQGTTRKSMASNASGNVERKFFVILDPQSRTRLAWMALGMFFMLYDLIVLPMQAFDIPRSWFTEGMQWCGQIFWTLDILVTFITAVYVGADLSTDIKVIAKSYVSSWFAFDLAIVAPLWVVQIAAATDSSEDQSGASNAAFFRFIRMMRFLRLARLAKFEHYLQEALAAVNSSSLMLLVGIFKLMIGMILVSHINACLWYWVGSSNGGWVGAYEGTSWFYKYLTSMHWAFTQFQGTSDILPGTGGSWVTGERAYAVCIVMGALILLSSFVGGLTNLMMQLHTIRESRMAMAHAVREFLSENEISKGLSIRVKRYIDWKQRMGGKMGKFDIVLQELPVALQIDLQEEVKAPLVVQHKFFSSLRAVHLRIFRLMCHGKLETLFPAPGEIIFTPHLEATKMFFCISGVSHYLNDNAQMTNGPRSAAKIEEMHEVLRRASGFNGENQDNEDGIVSLSVGNYLVEPVLWTQWEHCGVLMSVSDAQYYSLGGQDFEDLVLTYPPAHVSAVLYARRFVAGLNRFGRKHNDIIDIATFEEEEDSDDEDAEGKPSTLKRGATTSRIL